MPKNNQDGRTARFIQDTRDGTRGGGGGGGGFSRGHFGGGRSRNGIDHDDRNFKFTSHKSRVIQRKNKGGFNNRTDDSGDIIMDGTAGPLRPNHQMSGSGGRGKSGRRGNKDWRSRNKGDAPRSNFGPSWHKMTILNAGQFTPEFVVSAIRKDCRQPFIPVAYSIQQGVAIFFVETRIEAESIVEVSGLSVGSEQEPIRLMIKANGTGGPPPTPNFDANVENRLKSALEKRYNPATNSLNLSNFHNSPDIINYYYLPVFRAGVMAKILDILVPVAGTLVAIDLSNNRLSVLDSIRVLKDKAPSLRMLNLGNNKIRDMRHFDPLSGLPIQELVLEGNIVCDNYSDQERYIRILATPDGMKICVNFDRDVRKKFPKIIKLDGIEIAPQITFEIETPTTAPKSKGSFFCNDKAQQIVMTFVEQYFSIYDSDNRGDLLDAYHDKASLSLCASYPSSAQIQSVEPAKRLNYYLEYSRNILRNSGQDRNKRLKLLRQGKQDIIDFINKLPKTSHDTNGFVIDMPLATERFIQFSVVGVFKDRDERQQPLRTFNRTFFIIPQNQGYVIINELVFISLPTKLQIQTAFKLPAPTPSPSPIPYVQTPSVVPGVAPYTVSSLSQEEERNQMIIQFAQQSGLKTEWAKQCLEDNGWNFNKSAEVFTGLKAQGKVPVDFFQVK